MTRPRSSWLLLPVFLLAGPALASTWEDPSWAEMLAHSDLVLRGKVVLGGEDKAVVAPEAVLFGDAPAQLTVVGFNNRYWPADARAKESLKKDERYLFFLLKTELPGLFQVWTPSAGEFPIEGDKVRAALDRAGWPRSAPPMPLADLEAWVKSGLGRRTGKKADRKLCDAQRARLARPSERLASIQVLTIAGEDTWDDAFSALLTSQEAPERAAAALLLGGVAGPKAQAGLEALFHDAAPAVQNAAIEGLTARGPEAAGPVLVAALEKASTAPAAQRELMEPDRTGTASPAQALCTALVRLRYQPAVPVLQKLYATADKRQQQLYTWALRALGSGPPAAGLAKQLESKDPSEALYAIGDARQKELKPEVEKLLTRKDLDPHARGLAALVLEEIGDTGSAAKIAAAFLARRPSIADDGLAEGHEFLQALAAIDPAGQRKALGTGIRDRTGWDWELAGAPGPRAARLDWTRKTCAAAEKALAFLGGTVRCFAVQGLGVSGKLETLAIEVQSEGAYPKGAYDCRALVAKATGLADTAIGLSLMHGNGGEAAGKPLLELEPAARALESALAAVKKAPHPADKALLEGLRASGIGWWTHRERDLDDALKALNK